MGELAKFWGEHDRPMEQAMTWADVKANIMVKEVAAPWEMYEAALMLMECDRGVQRSLFPHLRVWKMRLHTVWRVD